MSSCFISAPLDILNIFSFQSLFIFLPSSQELYIVAIALLCLVIIIVLLVGLSASSSSCSLRERSMEIEEGASVVGVGGGGKIKVGVCVMEKKVKCGSEVLFSLIFFFCYCSIDVFFY